MPELPEVETVAKGLEQALLGDRFTKITLRRKDLRFPFPDGFAQTMSGKEIIRVGRRAKYLLMELADGTVMIGHLGMSGSFRIDKGSANGSPNSCDIVLDKHDHVIFETANGVTVRYHDPRRFGFLLLTTVTEMSDHPRLKDIGPEPLGNAFNGPVLAKNLSARKGPIKTAILDQKIVAGIGNIYACEALYRSGISPTKSANTLKIDQTDLLAAAIKDVLSDAIRSGGSTLRNFSHTDGELGYFQHHFQVYGREGDPCSNAKCDQVINRIKQAGRSTFFCPTCQK